MGDNKKCAICLGPIEMGQGHAIVTLECSHSFHSTCIGNSGVTYDSYLCPVCQAEWNDILPSTFPNSNTIINSGSSQIRSIKFLNPRSQFTVVLCMSQNQCDFLMMNCCLWSLVIHLLTCRLSELRSFRSGSLYLPWNLFLNLLFLLK